MQINSYIQQVWYGDKRIVSALLLPLSWLFALLAATRRALFRAGLLRSFRMPRPVIVVGNISVGGTGKTPIVAWLAEALRGKGFTPGVIVRGYRGASPHWPVVVEADSDPGLVGDEAVLLARLTKAIVVAGPDRVAAAHLCIEKGAGIVVSDDGLQHYRLRRDFEIAVIDGARGTGNGRLLPAGPLREGIARLRGVNAVLVNESSAGDFGQAGNLANDVVASTSGVFSTAAWQLPAAADRLNNGLHTLAHRALRPSGALPFRLVLRGVRNLSTGETVALPLFVSRFAGQRAHALAGIGNPNAFFAALRAKGLNVDPHPLPDHASFMADDLRFDDAAPVVMTEKDAVKCAAFADARCWAVLAEVEMDEGAAARLLGMIEAVVRSPFQPKPST